jgi:hypothetical protein
MAKSNGEGQMAKSPVFLELFHTRTDFAGGTVFPPAAQFPPT